MDITELCCITHQEATIMNSIRKPFRLNTNPAFTNLNKVCTIDLKHSNYIYPFGGTTAKNILLFRFRKHFGFIPGSSQG